MRLSALGLVVNNEFQPFRVAHAEIDDFLPEDHEVIAVVEHHREGLLNELNLPSIVLVAQDVRFERRDVLILEVDDREAQLDTSFPPDLKTLGDDDSFSASIASVHLGSIVVSEHPMHGVAPGESNSFLIGALVKDVLILIPLSTETDCIEDLRVSLDNLLGRPASLAVSIDRKLKEAGGIS